MNNYFNFENPFVPGTLVRAEEVNEVFSGVEVGFDGAQIQIDRTVRLPVGSSGDLVTATPSNRALRVIGFDADGNIQLRSSFAYVGDWMTGQMLKMNSVFRDPVSKNLYTVLLDHTSTSIAADLVAQKIMLAVNVADVFDATAGAQQAATESAASASASAASATQSLGFRNEALGFRNEAEGFRDEAETFSLTAINAPGTSATSTTSNTIDLTSPKTFSIQPGKEFVTGQFVVIAYTPDPAKYILAQVLTNDRINGILTVTALATAGTGTFADWTISLTAAATTGVTVLDVSNNAFYRVLLTDDVGSVIRRGVNGTQNLDYNPSTGQLRSVSFSGELFGNAATATLLQNSRLINGTSFNGGADITTASWGTARNLTIGNTAKSVDGSTNYSWSLAEIGAPATNGTGATGTWPINITGSAASATTAGSATSAATATDATNATNVNVTTTASNENFALVFSPSQTTGLKGLLMDSSGGRYNPATNTADFNISGNAATATTATNVNGGTATVASGTVTGNAQGYQAGWNVNGDITANRGNNTGVIYLGNAARYLFFNGSSYEMPGANLVVNGSTVVLNNGGTWSINITGSAAVATNASQLGGVSSNRAMLKRRAFIGNGSGTTLNASISTPEMGFTYGGSGETTGPYIAFGGLNGDIDYSCQIVAQYNGGGNRMQFRTRNDDAGIWNSWREVIHDGNYNSYSPTLTGGGASGTWGINITGNAGSAYGLAVQGAGSAPGANQVLRSDGSGYTYHNYINSNTGNSENPTISQIIVTNGGDNFYRKASIAHLGNSLNANGYQFVTQTGGSPAYYGARAWVNFNGEGTVSIRSQVNVSSINDLGPGNYRLNFSTAMPDVNYVVSGNCSSSSSAGFGAARLTLNHDQPPQTTTSVAVATAYQNSGAFNVLADVPQVHVAIHR